MKLTFLSPLYARQGPFACAYLDTSSESGDPERAIGLRLRQVRQDLLAQGVDPATRGAVTHLVGADRDVPGRHGQAIFAARGKLALFEELPAVPPRDTTRFTMLPDAMPLALQHAPDIPYLAVAVREDEPAVDIQAGRWPTTRVAAGEWVHRPLPRGERRPAAARIAGELAELAAESGAEAVVLAGDRSARELIHHQLPPTVSDLVVGLEGPGRSAEPGRALLEDELDQLFHGRLAAADRARLERFLAQRAFGPGPAEGLAAVVDALRAGRAEALLVNDPMDLSRKLWVGLTPRQLALSADELQAGGVKSCWPEPADAALIRAVVATGADLVVVPREELPLTDGLGVLLRPPGAPG
ncbi:hypothetical protein ACIGXM_11520 [Kitasatospora sp. NPDC052896]|uniref:baeRF2 domain-containing protein n=1 Tax=Kitasatospora sp. NPDC052896 TaxID=3364061 RepID=UPI0037CAD2F2